MPAMTRHPRSLVFIFLVLANLIVNITFGDFAPIDQSTISPRFFRDRNPLVLSDPGLNDLRERMFRRILVPRAGEQFVLSSAYGDEIEYLRMAMGEAADAPYRFRPAVPVVVRVLTRTYTLLAGAATTRVLAYRRAATAFWLLNAILLGTGALGVWLISRAVNTEHSVAVAAVVSFCTQLGVLQTAAYPMLDVASYAVAAWTLLALISKRDWLVVALLALAPIVRDALILLAVLALIYALTTRRWLIIIGCVGAVTSFAAIRVFGGASPLNVQYNWDLAHGKFSLVYARAHLTQAPGNLLACVVVTFGVLWVYVPFASVLGKVKLLVPCVAFFCLLLCAQIMLSSRVVRVLAIAYPMFLLIPLLLFARERGNNVT